MHSERKIDRIEERLASLESTLKSIAAALPSANTSFNATPSSHEPLPSRVKGRNESIVEDDPSPAFEGDSSLAAHSVQASEYLSIAVGSATFPQTQGMNAALQSLRSIVSRQNSTPQTRFHPRTNLPTFAPSSLRLPPLEAVMALIKKRKEQLGAFFEMVFPFSGLDQFLDILKSVYFNTDGYPTTTAILVYGGLYYVFTEACMLDKREGKEPLWSEYLLLCRDNLEICLDNVELLVPATDENVYALCLGVRF